MSALKLTNSQKALLCQIRDKNEPVSENYPPAKKLVDLKLAEWISGKYTDYLQITDAGLELLRDN